MESFVGRKAKTVRLHAPAHHSDVNGLGSLGTTVTEEHKLHGDLELTIVDFGNILVYSKSKKVELLIYASNVIDVVLKPK